MSKIYSVVIPVYKNEGYVGQLVTAFEALSAEAQARFAVTMEFVFVVDGSPDRSLELLRDALPAAKFASQLLSHSRNFGSFAAIRSGLAAGRGDWFGVIAADLQEPPELLLEFLAPMIAGSADVAVGRRETRDDPAASQRNANLFWAIYRRFVIPDVPPGGVDVFGCTRDVRDHLVAFTEAGSSLVGQLFWVGYRRLEVPYARRARSIGVSAWTFRKKLRYMMDSIFAFTDLPVRVLMILGMTGLLVSVPLGTVVAVLRIAGVIEVPGYAATMLAIIFFGALNTLGIGIVGSYAARAYENTKMRPLAIVERRAQFPAGEEPDHGG